MRQWKQRWRGRQRQKQRREQRQRWRWRQRQRRRQRRRRGPNMCECLCQFSLLTCCCCPPSHRATAFVSPASSVPFPQFVFRIIIKFYFRHSIWEMSSVYDGFLTSLVIEYVRLFSSSPLGLFSCSPVRLLLCSLILPLLFFWLPCRRQL